MALAASDDGSRKARRETLALGAILVVALILRVIHLNAGLWYDEVITLVQSVRLPPAELAVTFGSLNNHVLYTWLAKLCVALFGEAPWALRLPAVLFGVASIAAVWALVRAAGFRWAALAVAGLLAVSYHHVWFSQNARGYTGLLLFTTLAGLFLHRALTTGERRHWFAYAACLATSLLIHLSAAFLLVAQGLVVLIHGALGAAKNRASFSQWLSGPLIGFGLGGLVVLAAFAPMIGGMVEAFAKVAGPDEAGSHGVVAWKNPLWTFVEMLRSFGPLGIVVPIALVFAAFGAWRMVRAAPWIAAPYLIHLPLTIALLSALSMRIWPRYFFIDIAFVFAAVVIGAFVFADFVARRVKVGIEPERAATVLKTVGFLIMVAASLPLLVRNYADPKQDFEGAYALIEAKRAPGDRVTTLGIAGVYYRDYRGLDWPAFSGTNGGGRQWVVIAFPAHTRAYFGEDQSVLDSEFETVARFTGTLSGGDVIVYRSAAP